MYTITCVFCGQPFRSHTARRHYCSDLCFNQAHPQPAPKHPVWTHKEDRTLRQLAGELPVKAIAEKIGRTRAATQRRAHKLGVSLLLYGEKHPAAKYTDAQIERARQLHDERVSEAEIAAQTGINKNSVRDYIYYRWRLGAPIERYF